MQNIRTLDKQAISTFLESIGEKKFRAAQIQEWLWKHGVSSIDDMSNLSKQTRTLLKEHFVLPAAKVHYTQYSEDGTIKSRFILHDGHFIEGVLIPTAHRLTACISSQVGCSLSCKFCATGYMERKRNVTFDEIYDQVFLINEQALAQYGKKLTNIVFMGMGEPLLNYSNVLLSIERITAEDGMAMSPTRITVSTAGIAKMIERLADDNPKVNLALSLHAANDKKRDAIMPINETNNLEVLEKALMYYYKKTKNQITFEYILFSQFNDSEIDAQELIQICRRIPSKVNIIEYNPIDMAQFKKPNEEKTAQFMEWLSAHKVNARLRRSRGKDIDAACGQLANKGDKKE